MFNSNDNDTEESRTEDEIPSRSILHTSTNNTLVSEKCVITGEITGENDMDVLGKIEGTILLKNNSVRIEDTAEVNADAYVNKIKIYGKVVGNIEAGERIVIPKGGSVIGDMTSPSIVLEDGAYFKGKITMTDKPVIDIKKAKTSDKAPEKEQQDKAKKTS
ncbi:MAG: polymer-forming cytoskeletal protein [Gammaproteobacteria bacterium]|nr:MAG: polymer-forming cytoskeletal protein [Gammaproteobacteria bacterium]